MAVFESLTGITTGSTTEVRPAESVNHTLQLKATSPSTLVVKFEGSVDGTSFGTLTPTSGAVAGLAISNGQLTITSSGTYIVNYANRPLGAGKVTIVSGTVTSLDVVYMGE